MGGEWFSYAGWGFGAGVTDEGTHLGIWGMGVEDMGVIDGISYLYRLCYMFDPIKSVRC